MFVMRCRHAIVPLRFVRRSWRLTLREGGLYPSVGRDGEAWIFLLEEAEAWSRVFCDAAKRQQAHGKVRGPVEKLRHSYGWTNRRAAEGEVRETAARPKRA